MRLQGVLELNSGGLEQQWPQDSWAFTKQLPSLTELLDRQSSTGKGDWSCKETWQGNRSANLLLSSSGARKLFGAAA